jgi:hypothetical protein
VPENRWKCLILNKNTLQTVPFPRMKPLHFGQINPQTGTLFRFGDPNLRFVNGIGMFLEPGDPGFVPYGPPPLSVSEKTTKPKTRMAKSD